MILLNVAYYVHGAIAPILPLQLSPETKQSIRECIEHVEGSISSVFTIPLAVEMDTIARKKED